MITFIKQGRIKLITVKTACVFVYDLNLNQWGLMSQWGPKLSS